MRALTAGTNIEAPSGDYPAGRVKDANGGSGSIGNEILLGDIIQLFFNKLINDAGITPNGLPDNESNGYELLTALVSKIRGTAASSSEKGTVEEATIGEVIAKTGSLNINNSNFRGAVTEITTFTNGYTQGSIYGKLKYKRLYAMNAVHIFGSINAGTEQAVFTTLPVALRPVGTTLKYFQVHGNDSSEYTMEIASNGEMKLRDNVGGSIILIDIIYNIDDES